MPPATACLFRYPVAERYGLVWAFNGEEPHWDLPDFKYPDDELVFKIQRFETVMEVDPWIVCANTPDIQHIKALHGIQFAQEDPDETIEWTDHSMFYEFTGYHRQGERIDNRVGIVGTSIFHQQTDFAGKWFGFLAPFGMPRPGRTISYIAVCAHKDSGTPAEIDAFIDFVIDLERQILFEDVDIMQTIKFRPGTLTRSDKALAKFFNYVRNYPRAHPGAEFIR